MKVIENDIIPFKGFLAINLFGVVFVRRDLWRGLSCWHKSKTLNHEAIHTEQQKEMLYIFFYIAYFLEWLVRLIIDYKSAYRRISFEQEAYRNQGDDDYLMNRRHFAQWRKR